METNITKTQKVKNFFTANKSKIVKGAIIVTTVTVGVLATKYLQLKGAKEVLELTAETVEEVVTEGAEVISEVITEQV